MIRIVRKVVGNPISYTTENHYNFEVAQSLVNHIAGVRPYICVTKSSCYDYYHPSIR